MPTAASASAPNPYRSEVILEQVRAVKRKGESATIQMRKDVYSGLTPTGCRKTNRISSIESDGRVNYEEECSGSKRYSEDRTLKPVEVPWIEAAAIQPGQMIEVIVDRDSRRGRVLSVAGRPPADVKAYAYRPPVEALLQLREFSLAVPER